jgi:hypothetical protein
MGVKRSAIFLLVFLGGMVSGAILTRVFLEPEPPSFIDPPAEAGSREGTKDEVAKGPEPARPAMEPPPQEELEPTGEDQGTHREAPDATATNESRRGEETAFREAPNFLEPARMVENLRKLDDDHIMSFIQMTRKAMDERFLTPSQEILRTWSNYADKPDSGVNRILERGKFEGLTSGRGGGAYFSFLSRRNDYREPDIELQEGCFYSGFAGKDFGLIIPIEQRTIENITLNDVPDFLLLEDVDNLYAKKSTGDWSPSAELNRTYVVRAVHWNAFDLLAAFEVVQKDKHGVTFVWKILKHFPRAVRRK